MIGSLHAVGIEIRLQYDGHITASLTVVTIHDAHLHILRNALGHRLLHIAGILHATVFLQHVHHALLDLGEIQLVFLDDVTVEKHLIVHHGLHQIAHVKILLSQGLIQFLSHRITIPITRWNAAVLQETGVVHRSMVGTQENQIISFAHLLIEIRKEIGYRLVQAQISILSLYRMSSHLMTDIIRAGAAYCQQVGFIICTQLLAVYRRLCQINRQRIAERSFADNAVTIFLIKGWKIERQRSLHALADAILILVLIFRTFNVSILRIECVPFFREITLWQMQVVEHVHPLRQLVYIIRTGDKISALIIKPVGTVRIMTCRKNGSTVFQCHSHYLGSAVGCNLHLISESRNPEVSRRHQARLAVGAHRLHGFIIRAIHLLAILHKIVSGDSVDRRHTACIETSMTDGGNRWNIRNTGVFARETLVEQSLESTFTIALLIAIEIIPSHLVNHDAHYQFGALNVRNIHLLGSSRAASQKCQRNKTKYLIHFFLQKYCNAFYRCKDI